MRSWVGQAEALKRNPNMPKPTKSVPNAKFFGLVSSAFEPYLSHLIDLEDRCVHGRRVATAGEARTRGEGGWSFESG